MSKNKTRLTIDLSRKAWHAELKEKCDKCKIKSLCQSSCARAHWQAKEVEKKKRKEKLELKRNNNAKK